jgi:hypothetical protein
MSHRIMLNRGFIQSFHGYINIGKDFHQIYVNFD